jgi:hypothetical protein
MRYEPASFYYYFSVVFRSRHSQPSQPYYSTADLPRFTRMTSAPHCCSLLQRLCVKFDFCVYDLLRKAHRRTGSDKEYPKLAQHFFTMSRKPCRHSDVRKFDGIRSCLACGETVFESSAPTIPMSTQTTKTPTKYQYTHLNYTLGQEIRLVVLLPGSLDDPIRCEIVHVNLEDDPEFDAVSYTWATEYGDDSLSRKVNISNGTHYLPVTINCEAALRQLRRPGSRRKLWIDALCIDQSNISERNHQVGFMDLIYSKALCVRICMQDETRLPVPVDYEDLFSHIKEGVAKESHIDQLRHFFSLRYFQRAWVIQEVALARTACLLVNNHSLLLSATVIENMRSSFQSYVFRIPGPLLWDPEFSEIGSRSKTDIFKCLYATSESETTDNRDRVYATLALMEPVARSFIPVDYSLDIASVYANVLIAIVATRRGLDVISSIARRRGTNVGTSEDIKSIMHFVSVYCGYRDFRINTSLRFVQGIRQFEWMQFGLWHSSVQVSTVRSLRETHVSEPSSADSSTIIFERPSNLASSDIIPNFRIRAHYIDSLQSMQKSKNGSWFMTPESVVSGIGDPGSYYRWTLPFFRRAPSAENPQDLAQGANLEDIEVFVRAWGNHRASTEWFTTRFSVGYARAGFEVGDEVFALDGARAPWILRKIGDDTYQIVGECYLWAALELDVWNPGTKKGRWGEEDCQQSTERQTRSIEIHGTVHKYY